MVSGSSSRYSTNGSTRSRSWLRKRMAINASIVRPRLRRSTRAWKPAVTPRARSPRTRSRQVEGATPVSDAQTVEAVLDCFAAVEQRDEARQRELFDAGVEFHWPPSLPYGT